MNMSSWQSSDRTTTQSRSWQKRLLHIMFCVFLLAVSVLQDAMGNTCITLCICCYTNINQICVCLYWHIVQYKFTKKSEKHDVYSWTQWKTRVGNASSWEGSLGRVSKANPHAEAQWRAGGTSSGPSSWPQECKYLQSSEKRRSRKFWMRSFRQNPWGQTSDSKEKQLKKSVFQD